MKLEEFACIRLGCRANAIPNFLHCEDHLPLNEKKSLSEQAEKYKQAVQDLLRAESDRKDHVQYLNKLHVPIETPDADPVNNPPHYTAGSVECINGIQAALSPVEFAGFCKGNAMKYIWREGRKGGVEDIRKAIWYLRCLISKGESDEGHS